MSATFSVLSWLRAEGEQKKHLASCSVPQQWDFLVPQSSNGTEYS